MICAAVLLLGRRPWSFHGQRASSKNDRKAPASARVGAKRRLMDYPGLRHNGIYDDSHALLPELDRTRLSLQVAALRHGLTRF